MTASIGNMTHHVTCENAGPIFQEFDRLAPMFIEQ